MAKITLPAWVAKQNKLKSVILKDVKVHAETEKAYRLTGTADYSPSSVCWRCGREITREESISIGVGPDCAAALGIPWEANDVEMDAWVTTEGRTTVWVPKKGLAIEGQLDFDDDFTKVEESSSQGSSGKKATIKEDCSRILLKHDWVNHGLVNALKEVNGRKWHPETKTQTFDKTYNNIVKLYSILTQYGLVVTLDQVTKEFMNEAESRIAETAQKKAEKAAAVGVDSIADIKFKNKFENIDFGELLKTEPWGHQQQAIVFAAAILDLNLPMVDIYEEL